MCMMFDKGNEYHKILNVILVIFGLSFVSVKPFTGRHKNSSSNVGILRKHPTPFRLVKNSESLFEGSNTFQILAMAF